MELKQFDIVLHDAEVKLKRLKALYEQWFQGIERLEPTVPRKEFDRTMELLTREKPRNTAARFKLNTLQARYNTYTSHWQRIARMIEEGTYDRDIRRAQRRRRGPEREAKAEVKTYELDAGAGDSFDPDALFADDEISSVLTALDKEKSERPSTTPRRGLTAFSAVSSGKAGDTLPPLEGEDTSPNALNPFAKGPTTATFGRPKSSPPPAAPKSSFRPPTPESGSRPLPPPPPKAAASRVAPPPPPGAARPDPMKRLYEDFVAARKRQGEGSAPSYDKLVEKVETMRTQLRQKHGDKKIDFEVVVKDGKVGLKPKIR